ncbi:hypothetical protein FRB90_009950, partial [Tulasnella sp. 427]
MSTTSQFSMNPLLNKPLGLGASFFPSPEENKHTLTPKFLPGVSAESQSELASLLRLNNEKHHIHYNDQGFHNHLTHHLFAAFAMGCAPEVLSAAYKHHAEYQNPAFKSQTDITEDNWTEHLGKWDYYNSYMHFYASQIDAHGPRKTLEKYVFSKEANLTPDGNQGPQMLDRFMSGLLHPMIHAGHWAEFNVPGMLAEGLALTSVTSANSAQLFPADFFEYESQLDSTTRVRKLSLNDPRSSSPSAYTGGSHSLDIVHRMLQDPDLAAGKTCTQDSDVKYSDTLKSAGGKIRDYVKLWQIDLDREVPEKLEEISWLVALLYGLGGWRKGHDFRSDFFLLHLVTSSIFLSSFLTHLSFPSQSALLRAHFSVTLAYWVSRGRPFLRIADYYSPSAPHPSTLIPPALAVHPSKSVLGVPSTPTTNLPSNIWLPIVASSLNHPEEHLLKTQRALAHFDRTYGKATAQGYFHSKTELEGAEMLDGTLFWRVA